MRAGPSRPHGVLPEVARFLANSREGYPDEAPPPVRQGAGALRPLGPLPGGVRSELPEAPPGEALGQSGPQGRRGVLGRPARGRAALEGPQAGEKGLGATERQGLGGLRGGLPGQG